MGKILRKRLDVQYLLFCVFKKSLVPFLMHGGFFFVGGFFFLETPNCSYLKHIYSKSVTLTQFEYFI